jgi:hypothetical protein
MDKKFAVVEDGKVINVIIADDNFAKMYSESPDHVGECFEYDEVNEDDTRVARIGELYIGGKFISGTLAVELGLLTYNEAIKLDPDTIDRSGTKVEEV